MFEPKWRDALTDNLIRALVKIDNEEDCARFMEDLMTIRELRDLSQRLEVARLLREGATYAYIATETGASSATIGRVNRCISYGAEGYSRVLDKLEETDD
ncbi:MAG: hypothetical protein E7335_04130 [Clostridiales bacterium]|nr:hypothetical protein [Clostridiales bacterium]